MSVGKCFAMLSSAALLAAMLVSPAGAGPRIGSGYSGPGLGPAKAVGPRDPSRTGVIGTPACAHCPYWPNPWNMTVIGPQNVRRIP
jgi:hypothetical protein